MGAAKQHRETASRKVRSCAFRGFAGAVWLASLCAFAVLVAIPVKAQTVPVPAAMSSAFVVPSPTSSPEETTKGHGSVSIGYQNTYINGQFLPVPGGKAPVGRIRIESLSFDLDYFFADHWSGHIDIPFVEGRYSGNAPHCITNSPPQCQAATVPAQPHPESVFLDDGNYHGTWQDWHVGAAYHTSWNDYLITPSFTLTLPSHHYTFFAQSAPGQGLRKLEIAADLSHQFELSNFYYRIRLGHVFVEKTLGQSVDHNKVDLELGYFLSDAWTARAFATGKRGNGYTGPYDQTTDFWYHHDQRAEHNFANVGLGLDYRFDDKYTLSTAVQRLVWGQFVFDFKYSIDVRLAREF